MLIRFQKARSGITVTLWGYAVIGIGVGLPISIDVAPAWQSREYVDETAFTETESSVRAQLMWKSVKRHVDDAEWQTESSSYSNGPWLWHLGKAL